MSDMIKTTDYTTNCCCIRKDRRYGDHHLLYIMWRCIGGRVSRQVLSTETGIGEGSIRTAISELVSMGLADTARKGVGLTDAGKDLMREINIIVPTAQPVGMVPGEFNAAAILCGGAPLMNEFISTRDAAMMAGAEGCIPFYVVHDKCQSPFYDFMGYDYPDLDRARRSFRMVDGDAAVVCGASNLAIATMSVFAGLLDLIKSSSVEIPGL